MVELLFPSACAVCREPHPADADGIVCGVCLSRIVPLAHPRCTRCGHPRLSANIPLPPPSPAAAASRESGVGDGSDALPPCRWCERLPSYVRAVRSVARMDVGSGASLVHALKYGRWQRVSEAMGRRMARLDFPRDVVEERVALVPLPLARTRERERGYNQAASLARAVAQQWHLPVWHDVIARRRNTRSQVRLTPSERVHNVSGAFAASPSARARLRGAHVILVDDVITTAASLNAAALALTEGGTRIISYLTFGRAPDPGDRAGPDLDLDTD